MKSKVPIPCYKNKGNNPFLTKDFKLHKIVVNNFKTFSGRHEIGYFQILLLYLDQMNQENQISLMR